jgi:hypothetical protein
METPTTTMSIAERNFIYSCKTKKIELWKRYCANMTYESQLTDIWKMAQRLRGFRSPTVIDRNLDYWLPGFASRIAPDFVPNQQPDGGLVEWLTRSKWMSLKELYTGEITDGRKFIMFKFLPLKKRMVPALNFQ